LNEKYDGKHSRERHQTASPIASNNSIERRYHCAHYYSTVDCCSRVSPRCTCDDAENKANPKPRQSCAKITPRVPKQDAENYQLWYKKPILKAVHASTDNKSNNNSKYQPRLYAIAVQCSR